jgi:hypothetical protein
MSVSILGRIWLNLDYKDFPILNQILFVYTNMPIKNLPQEMVQVFCLTRTAKIKILFPALFLVKRDFCYAMIGLFLFGDSFGLKVMIFECKYTA